MNRQTYYLVGVALVLATLYIVNFTDVFKHKDIQIRWSISRANAALVSFYLDKPYTVTSIKVVSAEDAKTNKFPHALWNVTGLASGVEEFMYGGGVTGMKPVVATAVPEPLQRGTDYEIFVESNKRLKGEKIFSLP